jgi:hypothetical protein
MVIRNGKDKKELTATLKKYTATTAVLKNKFIKRIRSGTCRNRRRSEKYNVRNGLKVTKLYDGKLKSTRTFEGFIITSVNRIKVTTVQSLLKRQAHKRRG